MDHELVWKVTARDRCDERLRLARGDRLALQATRLRWAKRLSRLAVRLEGEPAALFPERSLGWPTR